MPSAVMAKDTRMAVMDILNAALTRCYNSVAQYMLDSSPYVRTEDAPLVACIESIAAEDRVATERLAGVIEALEGIAMIAPYTRDVAELNYLAIEYLGGVLEKHLRDESALFARYLAEVKEFPPARAAIDETRHMLEEQIARLAAVRAHA